MRRMFLLMCAVVLVGVVQKPPEIRVGLTVGELFTSQGCNTCPPADRLAGRLAQNPSVLILSFHVDYWDYLGWKDTFAQPAFTQRQIAYGRALGVPQPYTPQFILDGRRQFIGSDEPRIQERIKTRLQSPRHLIVPSVHGKDVQVFVPARAPGDPYGKRATLWLVLFQNKAVVDVGRGENRGRRLTYTNVVRRLHLLGTWYGENLTFELKNLLTQLDPQEEIGFFLQEENHGFIIGAARIILYRQAPARVPEAADLSDDPPPAATKTETYLENPDRAVKPP